MSPVTIELDQCDFDMIREKSKNSTYFFQKCVIVHEDESFPFSTVTIKFVPDRLTRRPLVAMIYDLIYCIKENDPNKDQLYYLVWLFLLKLE